MKPTDVAWAAGYLEGEGCFRLETPHLKLPHYRTTRVVAASTDKEPLDRLLAIFGGTLKGPYKGRKQGHKSFYRWHLSKKVDVIRCLHAIYEQMSPRRQTAIRNCLNNS